MDARKIAWQLVGSLILIFGGGWILGGILNTAAILSPQMVSIIDCPAGSTARENWVQASYDQPGQKSLRVTCVNQSGTSVTPLTDAQSSALEYKYFYPAGVIIMALLVGIWFIRSNAKKMGRAGPWPAS